MTRSLSIAGSLLLAAVCLACTPPEGRARLDARVSSAPVIARGRSLYARHCALCHGDRGDGRGPRRLAFANPPRDFSNVIWRRSTSPGRIAAAIRNGLPGTPMAAWADLGDDAVEALTAFVWSIGDNRSQSR